MSLFLCIVELKYSFILMIKLLCHWIFAWLLYTGKWITLTSHWLLHRWLLLCSRWLPPELILMSLLVRTKKYMFSNLKKDCLSHDTGYVYIGPVEWLRTWEWHFAEFSILLLHETLQPSAYLPYGFPTAIILYKPQRCRYSWELAMGTKNAMIVLILNHKVLLATFPTFSIC